MRPFDIEAVRADFPILGREVYGRPLVYLDSAATAQKPRRVIEAMDAMLLRHNGNIHRATHLLAEESTEAYEAARETVRSFIGAAHPEEIVFTSGATAGLNLAARSLCEAFVRDGDNVIVSELEHHSNIVPWQLACRAANATGTTAASASVGAGAAGVEIRVLPFSDDGLPRLDLLESLIDERTRVLAITQCSNVLGTRPDIARACEIAHRHGVIVVVDGCQGVVHGGGEKWVNVAEMGCDFYAFSGHKLYGPLGIGVLYGKKSIFESIPPFFGGGDMVKSVFFESYPPKNRGGSAKKTRFFGETPLFGAPAVEKYTTFSDLPFKFEAGTANYVGAVGLAEAIRYLSEFDPRDIARHEKTLLDAATDALSAIDGLTIHGTAPGKAPIVSFTVEGVHPLDLGMVLDKGGVAVRTGTHCAQPLVNHYGVESMCRASFAIYNTLAEVEALAAATQKAVKMLRR